jgi:hypothetical protein
MLEAYVGGAEARRKGLVGADKDPMMDVETGLSKDVGTDPFVDVETDTLGDLGTDPLVNVDREPLVSVNTAPLAGDGITDV